ncbi:pantetheine-phosphate adenylyltransferase [Nicoliella spurrieriana]|uniref:Phosphopantetheine adenylyltransferase n=1 Tax=Nicoliella spurrieriana TaxID=2925830 RepID=A0A976RRU6_9LACO|nr:pantetheine-phosphate adenylyltransferase [Nicoliella spurrieriana]UQS86466.1 pantetheine-phosphate adenylyltransferase [Nicoliella spurrieriana]
MTKAVFPGSFDPLTNGHLDIINRASRLFDHLVVVVGYNNQKKSWIDVNKRVDLIQRSVDRLTNVSVLSTTGLIVDLMEQIDAQVIIRGVRNTNDFDAEKSLANFNRQLGSDIDTVLIPTTTNFESLSSTRVRELYHFKKSVKNYVPQPVFDFINEKRGLDEK